MTPEVSLPALKAAAEAAPDDRMLRELARNAVQVFESAQEQAAQRLQLQLSPQVLEHQVVGFIHGFEMGMKRGGAVVDRATVLALCQVLERAVGALEQIRPSCDACGEPATTQYDSNGEGLYWLCDSKAEDHDEDHYCGTEVYSLGTALSDIRALVTVGVGA